VRRVDEGTLKKFTAGDRMSFDRKNMSIVHAHPTARVVLTTNSLPKFADRSGGVWRRVMVMPFNVQVSEERKDIDLVNKLCAELPGIFHWALEGLQRLRRRRTFTASAVCAAALLDHKAASNPARTYLTEEVRQHTDRSIQCSRLFEDYVASCLRQGFKPLDIREFGKEVTRKFPRANRRRIRGEYHYDGLTFNVEKAEQPAVGVEPHLRVVKH
jgi:putative DNA primase/helicase